MRDFVASAASIGVVWGDVEGNLRKIGVAADRAARDGARLLLLPECSLTGADWPTGASSPAVEDVAIGLDSHALCSVAEVAKRTGVTLVPGFYEKLGGRIRVSQAIVGPRGLVGVYRKVHEGERSSTDAELFPVFDLGFARVGISVCFDNMFPECARILALKGAEVLLAPFTSLPLTRKAWRLERLVALRARAQDNRLFVLSASHSQAHVAGRPSEWGYSGICCAVNPLGEVMAESRGRAGTPQRLVVGFEERLRRTYLLAHVPSLRARRAQDYAPLADEGLQRRYLQSAPAFAYDERGNRNVVAKRQS